MMAAIGLRSILPPAAETLGVASAAVLANPAFGVTNGVRDAPCGSPRARLGSIAPMGPDRRATSCRRAATSAGVSSAAATSQGLVVKIPRHQADRRWSRHAVAGMA